MGPRDLTRSLLLLLPVLYAACRGQTLSSPAPLSMRDQHPVELTALYPKPRPFRIQEPGPHVLGLDTDWTNLWLLDESLPNDLSIDGELVRIELRLGWGLGHDMDLEVGIPLVYASGGAMDGLIEAWHDVFNLAQSGRTRYPRDLYDISFQTTTESGPSQGYGLEEDRVGLGDVPVHLAWAPFRGEWNLCARGSVELPTGSESRGFGNGGFDWGLSVQGAWHQGPLAVFLWGGWTWIATPDRAGAGGFAYADRPFLGGGFEWAFLERTSVLLQAEVHRSVLDELDDPHANRDQAILMGGFRHRFSDDLALDLGIGENVHADLVPDVTLHVGLRLDL
ncbi:MAG: DUF3187 family protein [Planctomycetota bacterium]